MDYDDYAELLDTTDVDLNLLGDGVPTNWDIESVLAQAQEAERQRVEVELAEIDTHLRERTALHEDLVQELEWDLTQYRERLERLITTFASPERRARPQARIHDLAYELRQERRQHWQVRQRLLADRRDLRRELAELDDDILSHLL